MSHVNNVNKLISKCELFQIQMIRISRSCRRQMLHFKKPKHIVLIIVHFFIAICKSFGNLVAMYIIWSSAVLHMYLSRYKNTIVTIAMYNQERYNCCTTNNHMITVSSQNPIYLHFEGNMQFRIHLPSFCPCDSIGQFERIHELETGYKYILF